MEKMGYIIGTGLGKRSDGRLEPVTAEILPVGKSLGIEIILYTLIYILENIVY